MGRHLSQLQASLFYNKVGVEESTTGSGAPSLHDPLAFIFQTKRFTIYHSGTTVLFVIRDLQEMHAAFFFFTYSRAALKEQGQETITTNA